MLVLVLVLSPVAFAVGFVSKFHFEKIVQSFEIDLVVQDLELPISVEQSSVLVDAVEKLEDPRSLYI